MRKKQNNCSASLANKKISDEDIYLMFMLHRHQRMSCEKIARKFGLSTGKVRDIIARRVNSGCCG